LGQVLTEYPTREEAQKIAHNWEPITEPVYRRMIELSLDNDEPIETYEEIPDQVLKVRSDDGYALGVTSKTLETVTNGEMYDIAEAIQGESTGSIMYETGGSLLGGRKVWLLIRLAQPLRVSGDPNGATIAYYALQNNHDGMGSFRGQGTTVRIVCDNTSRAADLDASVRGTEFVFRHTKSVHERIEQAKEALAGWRSSLRVWQDTNRRLLQMDVEDWQVNDFIERFVPMPPPHLSSSRVEHNVNEARGTLRTILGSKTCEGIAFTAYGLVQAAIEYHQHYRKAQSVESRFKRAYLDKSQIITDAVELAEAVAVG
jgi:phage/plasmid-like protein (TIGR03299 family)